MLGGGMGEGVVGATGCDRRIRDESALLPPDVLSLRGIFVKSRIDPRDYE